MTDKTQPHAGSTHIIRYALELGLLWIDGDGRDKVREALDALDILEAQLEAIGAGGVSGPLMARAADHFPGVTKMTARWYMVDKDGMATLCTDREDAEQEAKDANMAWPHLAPHRAVQLVEAGTSAAELHPSPPEGMVMVPREPTEAMKVAAVKYANDSAVYKNLAADVLRIEEGIYGEVYEAMIAAAPPTTPAGSGKGE